MASKSLGTLTLDLVAKIGGFEKGMDQAARASEKRLKEIQATASKIGKGIGLALAGAATGLAVLVKKQIDVADEFSLLAQKTGLSVEALSQLDYAAKLSGIEDLQTSLVKFNRSISEAAQGSKAQSDAFKSLGVNVKDLDGNLKPTEQLLLETAEAFSKAGAGANKTALAVDLFGKSGAELIPLLNEGEEGIRKFREEADRLGLTLSTETAQAANDFNDAIDKLGFAAVGVGRQLVNDLAKPMQDFAEFMSDPATIDSLASFGKAIVVSLGAAIKTVTALVSGIDRLYGFITSTPTNLVDTLERIAKLEKEIADSKVDEGGFDFLNDLSPQRVEEVTKELEGLYKQREKMFAQQREQINRPDRAPESRPDLDRIDTAKADREAAKAAKELADAERQLNKELEAQVDILDDFVQDGTSIFGDDLLSGLDLSPLEDQLYRGADALEFFKHGVVDFENTFTGAFEAYAASVENVSALLGGDLVTALDSAIAQTADLAANTILWGEGGTEALKELARSIITDVVSSLIRAGVQMAANFALQQAGIAATTAASTAAAATTAAAQVSANTAIAASAAPAAALTSLASFGANAAVALAGIAAVFALTKGFKGGGYTGDGPLDEVAGVVHKGEYVLSNKMLKSLKGGGGPMQLEVRNFGEPLDIRVERIGNRLIQTQMPRILEAADSATAAGVSSGLGRTGQAIGSKFGVQGSAVR